MIKVVWVCSVSNPELRKHLDLGRPWWHRLIRKLLKREQDDIRVDTAQWNTNAIREFESIDEVDLHVIFVHPGMRKKYQQFKESGINFYAVSQGDTSFLTYLGHHFKKGNPSYKYTWGKISSLVEGIRPDIIHMMGAENPPYSWSISKLPRNIPVLVQLQTLTHNPLVLSSYPDIHPEYELPVIKRADYLGSPSKDFPWMVRQYIKKDPIFVNTPLMLTERPDFGTSKKEFDFVYFSNNINKAIDLAIEAFAIAYCKHPGLTLDVIGGSSKEERLALDNKLEELGIKHAVVYEGKLPTHEDVISQIKKARIALLPLKSDFVSGTIREAIWSGLPVVTTITQGTPQLNSVRESVLLSETGNHEALAANMLLALDNSELTKRLWENSIITVEELYGNNKDSAQLWVEAYHACIANFHEGTPLPDHIVNKY